MPAFPLKKTSPSMSPAVFRPASTSSKVVLPAPDPPMSAHISPGLTRPLAFLNRYFLVPVASFAKGVATGTLPARDSLFRCPCQPREPSEYVRFRNRRRMPPLLGLFDERISKSLTSSAPPFSLSSCCNWDKKLSCPPRPLSLLVRAPPLFRRESMKAVSLVPVKDSKSTRGISKSL